MARRYLLVGSGPGAMSAAETIRGADPAADITAVSAEPEGYYSRPGLAYLLAKEEPESALFPFSPKDLARLNLHMLTGRAAEIDRTEHRVTLADGRRLPYDRLLLATGSLAVPLRVPGVELDGVIKLDDLADARGLIHRSRDARAAIVAGGGITALEIVEGLRAHGVHVHYLMRKDRYWGDVLSERESSMVEQSLRAQGVDVHHRSELAGVLGHDGRVDAVELRDGTRIPCDLVAVAIGVLPRKQLAESAGLDCARGVLVDEYLRSSDGDIFASGDIAEVADPVTGRRDLEVLWNTAVEKGRVAGHNMASGPMRRYEGGTPLNVTRLAGYRLTIIGTVGSGEDSDLEGLSRGDSETWRSRGDGPVVETQIDGGAHVRLALDGDTIAGAVVMGDQALSFPLQDLIGARADVSGMATRLTAPSAPVAELVNAAWSEWRSQRV